MTKLRFRNIFGRPVDVKLQDIPEEIIKVSSLPDTSNAEAGKMYYNSTDGGYYVLSNGAFIKLGETPKIEIVSSNFTAHDTEGIGGVGGEVTVGGTSVLNNYDIEPNKLYLFGTVTNSLTLHLTETSETEALCYYGRFTANLSEFGGTTPTELNFVIDGASFTDNTGPVEDGHTYEFNIMHGICLLTDITTTVETIEENDGNEDKE